MDAAIRRGVRRSGIVLFLAYLIALVYFLFFAESYGRGLTGAAYDCNFLPFQEIRRYLTYWEMLGMRSVALNLLGNIVGFVPFGALVPLLSRSARRAWKTGILCMEVSMLVETAQFLFRVGCCDVDDVILNTAGGLIGYALYRLADGLYLYFSRKRRAKKNVGWKSL